MSKKQYSEDEKLELVLAALRYGAAKAELCRQRMEVSERLTAGVNSPANEAQTFLNL